MGHKNTTATLVQSLGNTEARLVLVKVLVLFSALVWVVLEGCSSYRRRHSHSFFRIVVWTVYTLFTVLAPYTIGLLQAGPFRDQTFVLLGTFLLLIQVNSDALSVYSIEAIEQWKWMLVQQLLQIFLVLLLIVNGSGGNKSYNATILIFWVYSIILTIRKFWTIRNASKTGGLVEQSKAIADYMLGQVENQVAYDASTMKGYKYIFHGDEKVASGLPAALEDRVALRKGFITIDSVWGWIDNNSDIFKFEEAKQAFKEIALSFSLFKLLKRRFCGYHLLGEAGLEKTLNLVVEGLLSKEDKYVGAFGVIEEELGFLYDFFYTRFETNRPFHSLAGVVIGTVIVWNIISGALSRHYHRSSLEQRVNGIDVIRCVYHCVACHFGICVHGGVDILIYTTPSRASIVQRLIKWSTDDTTKPGPKGEKWRLKETSTWERKLGQYDLLLNSGYNPWNVLSYLSLGLIEAKRKGQKAGKKTKLTDEVIIKVLSQFKHNSGRLENGQSALGSNQFSWACTPTMPSPIHTILLWHIATFKLPKELPLTGNRLVAESLLGYCAYLVAFVPEMLPGHAYDTRRIFDAVVMECQAQGGFVSIRRMGGYEAASELMHSTTTMRSMGTRLAKELKDKVPDEAQRWKLLAAFWAEFILFLAPSDNVEIHTDKLAAGGEFMTHLWALLTHAGILERPSSSFAVDPPAGSSSV